MERLTLGGRGMMAGRAQRGTSGERNATMQGQGCRWRVANKADVGTTLKQTRLTLEERGEDGAPLFPALAALTAPPPHRRLAV